MKLDFKEKSTLGGGWSIEVRSAGIPLGHIRRNPVTGAYMYFKGNRNVLNPSLSDDDLEALKAKIPVRL
jgi:hypothetical protein